MDIIICMPGDILAPPHFEASSLAGSKRCLVLQEVKIRVLIVLLKNIPLIAH